MKLSYTPFHIGSITEQHRILKLPKPLHPLVSVFRLEDSMHHAEELNQNFSLGFYCVSLKQGFKGKFKYGYSYYDFEEGVLSFLSPNQILANQSEEEYEVTGISLSFHPDFIRNYPLAKKMKEYGFFNYTANEALHLSEREEQMIGKIFKAIETEYQSPIDAFSQDVIIANIDLLLTHANRYYNRQFITRKTLNHDLLTRINQFIDEYYEQNKALTQGLLTVEVLADAFHVSSGYLSDMLRSLVGQSAQQYIHNQLIEKSKLLLASTNLSVSEIAYQFGFEYPQSFNKLFRNKTNFSPLQYRQSFN